MSEVRIGASGWSCASWRGPFYPPALKPGATLAFYSERFSTTGAMPAAMTTPRSRRWERIGGWRGEYRAVFCFFDNGQKSTAPHDAERLIGLAGP